MLNNSPVFAVCKVAAAFIRQEQERARPESEVCGYMRFIQTRNSAADIG